MVDRVKKLFAVILILVCFSCSFYKKERSFSSRPIKWPKYKFESFQIKNGIKFFLIQNHKLPLIRMIIVIRAGEVQEGLGKEGLFELLSETLKSGGSKKYPEDKFLLLFEERGADFDISFDKVSGEISLVCLKEDFYDLLPAILDLLTEPLLPEKKLELARKLLKNRIYQQKDSPLNIALTEFKKLIYGKNSPYAAKPTPKSIENIKREDLVSIVKKIFTGKNLMIGLEGDFDRGVITLLKKQFLKLPTGSLNHIKFSDVKPSFKHRVFFINKPGLDQATVIMGHLGGFRQDPNYPAIEVFNMILSGGFSGKLFQNIRTKRGLVYSIFGRYECRYFYPGLFFIVFQTANPNVKKAVVEVKRVLKEIQQTLSEKDIKEAKEIFLNSLVFRYDHPFKILRRRLFYEYRGMDPDSFEKLISGIKKVNLFQVKKVANDYIKPDGMTILIVGDKKALTSQIKSLNAKELKN